MSRKPPPPRPAPKPNPGWSYSPPVVSKRGEVWVDATQLSTLTRMYDAMGVPKVPGDGRSNLDEPLTA